MLAVALLFRSPTTAVLAGGALLGLAATLTLTVPLGARLRRQRLEFAWWHAHGDSGRVAGGVVAGAPFTVGCYMRNRGNSDQRFAHIRPVLADGVELLEEPDAVLDLTARARTEFAFRLTAAAAGRIVLQGLAVSVPGPFALFHAPLYFPNPLVIKVLPRASVRNASLAMSTTGLPVERTGQTLLRRPGSGTELREIREHQPGDPFKSIAWKPSARRGKLMVREVEREVQETVYILLDISGSMRGGAPGTRKLDYCIEIAALKAREALERGDRVGLMTVDGRIISHVLPGESLKQMIRIYDALLRATEIIDEDLTEVNDEDVVALVGRYLKYQDGVDHLKDQGWDLDGISRQVGPVLLAEREQDQVVAGDETHAELRRFCRLRGIPLRYRADTRGYGKAAGLADALQEAGGRTRMPRSLVVLTDFDGILNPSSLVKILGMLRRRQHAIVFIFPDAGSVEDAATAERTQDLCVVYGMQERRRRDEAARFLGKLGIPLVVAAPLEPPSRVVTRTLASRRVA